MEESCSWNRGNTYISRDNILSRMCREFYYAGDIKLFTNMYSSRLIRDYFTSMVQWVSTLAICLVCRFYIALISHWPDRHWCFLSDVSSGISAGWYREKGTSLSPLPHLVVTHQITYSWLWPRHPRYKWVGVSLGRIVFAVRSWLERNWA